MGQGVGTRPGPRLGTALLSQRLPKGFEAQLCPVLHPTPYLLTSSLCSLYSLNCSLYLLTLASFFLQHTKLFLPLGLCLHCILCPEHLSPGFLKSRSKVAPASSHSPPAPSYTSSNTEKCRLISCSLICSLLIDFLSEMIQGSDSICLVHHLSPVPGT